ncbi:PdxA family protein [Sphingobium sp. SCG-1]|uniref:PdxA family dehydrogenase n=1 Tax=Sphingobium sp. SCG-1 TaxID=2072936 RepID=UPI001CB9BABE|nr:4-hydroxythreonine-4-phosphate dehydrogenase PdxA [Sphingobium sp. SCG-1]
MLVAIGDPNGIGPEVAVKAAVSLRDDADLRPVIVGERHIVEPLARDAGFEIELESDRWGRQAGALDLLDVACIGPDDYQPGSVSAAAGRATIAYVEASLGLIREGCGRALVACPHSETAVNSSGRSFSGYPNLLAELLGTGADSVFLMLVGGGLRIVHVTLHEGIGTALGRLTPDLIERTVRAADASLRLLGIVRPRIGVFGINPHAGEHGLFGDEDERIVVPALERLRASGIDVDGPEGADIILVREGYDAFVAMYHDQGHIPVKLMAGRQAAGLSIGGGLLFSSVGHGAAFDIAGKGVADPAATIRAIRLVGGVA